MFPSIEVLALATGLSVSAVGEHLGYAVKAGWLWRFKVRGTRHKYWHYSYEPVVPAAWNSRLARLREWEKDAGAVEARLLARKRPRVKHPVEDCPVYDGNGADHADDSGRAARPGREHASSTTENHPVHDCTTSTSTSSETETRTSCGAATNAVSEIEERLVVRSRRRAALQRPPVHDPVAHVEKCFRLLQQEGKPLDPFNQDDIRMAARSCCLTDQQAADAVRQLLASGKLPIQDGHGNTATSPTS
jgi:hypothetical protein